MKPLRSTTGLTIFILFFGIALLDAFRTLNWMMMLFWIAMGLAFFWMDNREKKEY